MGIAGKAGLKGETSLLASEENRWQKLSELGDCPECLKIIPLALAAPIFPYQQCEERSTKKAPSCKQKLIPYKRLTEDE